MRAAKWALITLAGMLGILVLVVLIGFVYGLCVLGVSAVRSIARRFSGPCTK